MFKISGRNYLDENPAFKDDMIIYKIIKKKISLLFFISLKMTVSFANIDVVKRKKRFANV